MPAVNLEYTLGTTWEITIPCVDANGASLDLTGATVFFRVASASSVVIDLDSLSGHGIIIADAKSGLAYVKITPLQQILLPVALYQYEAISVMSDGSIIEQQVGYINAIQSLFEIFPWIAPVISVSGQLDFSDPNQSGLIGH